MSGYVVKTYCSIGHRNQMNISRYYRPELDVFRLIAFLMMFISHSMDFIPIPPVQHFWNSQYLPAWRFRRAVFFLLSAFPHHQAVDSFVARIRFVCG